MWKFFRRKTIKVPILLGVIVACFLFFTHHDKVDFSTQVKPLINNKCISCHGGVKAKGGFSLLFRDEALAKTASGKYAIIPGDPQNSELIKRINHNDPEERMPYKHDPLTEPEKQLLTDWIKQGAIWGEHWAYVPVKNVPVPSPSKFFGLIKTNSLWAGNPIDNFIEEKLKAVKLPPSPQADKPTLLRRVSLDITGLPAPDNLAQKFLNDSSTQAYTSLVDSLLALPQYGERWTATWMDLARYADTKGYERDDSRSIWKYRDWLIKAFNEDKKYDQFLVEQIAGDLLPNASDDDYIATAFHRNTMTNDEGGTDNEEFRTSAVMDRVNTTWQALMGTTFGCVQCHSHPYDPFKHEEYYKFLAFFNNTRDEDSYEDYPLLRIFNDSLQQDLIFVKNWLSKNASSGKAAEVYSFLKTWQPSYNSISCDSFINADLSDTKWLAMRNNAICRLKKVNFQNNSNKLIIRYQASKPGGILNITLNNASGKIIGAIPLPVTKKGWTMLEADIETTAGLHDVYFNYTNHQLPEPDYNGAMFSWFYFTEELSGKKIPGYKDVKKKYWALLNADATSTPVMVENPGFMHRASNIFERGNWLVKGAEVAPDVPHSLNSFPANTPRNRLGLARWLTDKNNPLTARTMVNRVWEQLFGTGLVETIEDMGTQGSPPEQQALLDWLSYQFMHKDNWSTKQLVRKIVMSKTYQQDSKISPEALQKDPYNKLYARGARVRLSAEQIRDQALFISGKLNKKMYGSGVYPYQPEGVWLSPWNGGQWTISEGDERYRRALYTYWKRSAAYPSMLTFDGVSREVCTVRRIRTNTPLQALTTLNDSAYIDLSRFFAIRMQSPGVVQAQQQISNGYLMATSKLITSQKLQPLLALYNQAFTQYKNDSLQLKKIMTGMEEYANPHTAALTVVANALLNLDEVLTKN